MGSGHIRIGIDTGGTFTDIVAFDERSGQLHTTKTPSTPADPAQGFMTGVHKILDRLGAGGDDVSAVSHGTTVATNQLLEGKVTELGFITTEGYEFVLEIARQSVPDGYGNSYFWVKPERIVPAHLVKTVGGRLDHTGAAAAAVRRAAGRRGGPVVPRAWHRHHRRLLPARLRQPRSRGADAGRARAGTSRGGRVDLVAGAARVPRVRAVDDDARGRGGQAPGGAVRPGHQRPAGHAESRTSCRST